MRCPPPRSTSTWPQAWGRGQGLGHVPEGPFLLPQAPGSPPAAKTDSSLQPQTPFRAPPRLTVTDLPRVAPEVTLSKLPTHPTVLRSLRVRSSQEVRSEHLDPQQAVSQARGVQVRPGVGLTSRGPQTSPPGHLTSDQPPWTSRSLSLGGRVPAPGELDVTPGHRPQAGRPRPRPQVPGLRAGDQTRFSESIGQGIIWLQESSDHWELRTWGCSGPGALLG